MKTNTYISAMALVGESLCAGAGAQQYPARTVQLMVPYAAGGAIDILSRRVAARLAEAHTLQGHRPGDDRRGLQ